MAAAVPFILGVYECNGFRLGLNVMFVHSCQGPVGSVCSVGLSESCDCAQDGAALAISRTSKGEEALWPRKRERGRETKLYACALSVRSQHERYHSICLPRPEISLNIAYFRISFYLLEHSYDVPIEYFKLF